MAEKLFDDFYRILYEMFPLSFLLQKKIEKNTSGYFSYIYHNIEYSNNANTISDYSKILNIMMKIFFCTIVRIWIRSRTWALFSPERSDLTLIAWLHQNNFNCFLSFPVPASTSLPDRTLLGTVNDCLIIGQNFLKNFSNLSQKLWIRLARSHKIKNWYYNYNKKIMSEKYFCFIFR